MKTGKIYQQHVYLSKLQTEIVDVFPLSDLGISTPSGSGNQLALILKDTIFFPGGGGQSCDLGTISLGHDTSLAASNTSNSNSDGPNSDGSNSDGAGHTYDVVQVLEKDGEIYHVISTDANPCTDLCPGTPCTIEIDWDRRFDNMQRHCGEHILSGICYDLWGGVNRGFHMGDDYMTIDISLEDDPPRKGPYTAGSPLIATPTERPTEVTWEMAIEAEHAANQVIWSNLPVIAHHFDRKEDAAGMPLRKALAIDEDITIVTIGSDANPADSVACCGTHPSTSGQVGLIKIYKVEPNKGMFRIFFEAGRRALLGYDARYDALTRLEKDLSSGFTDLMDKYAARQEKNREVRDRLFHLTKNVIQRERDLILSQMGNTENSSSQVYTYDYLTLDDLIELGRSMEGQISGILFLLHSPSNTLLLFSDKLDCGKMVKDNVAVFNGKGGGNNKFARAIFTRPDDTEMFISAVNMLQK